MDMERNYDHSPYSWLIKEESSTRQEFVLGSDTHHVDSANYRGGRYHVFAPAVLLSRLFAKRWKVEIAFKDSQAYRRDDDSFTSQIIVNPWERATLTKAWGDTFEIEVRHFRDHGSAPSKVYVFAKAALASIEAYLSPLEANLHRHGFEIKEVIRSGKHDQLNWQKPLAKLTAYFTGERVGHSTFEEHRIAISVMFDRYVHIDGICCDRPHVSILDADHDLKTKALSAPSQSCPNMLTPWKATIFDSCYGLRPIKMSNRRKAAKMTRSNRGNRDLVKAAISKTGFNGKRPTAKQKQMLKTFLPFIHETF